MMKKAQRCRVRFSDMLYQYRTSPVAGKRESPIELLEQRRPRTNMPHLGKSDPRRKTNNEEPQVKSHNYPIGTKVMYRAGPNPNSSYHCTWYPARVTSHLEEPRSYLLENNYSKVVRRTEQHIRPFYTPPRRYNRQIDIEYYEAPAVAANKRSHSTTIGPKRKVEARKQRGRPEATTADRWRNRNLRPTQPRINRHNENPRCPSPSPSNSQQSPDRELRRSSRISARRSFSDTD